LDEVLDARKFNYGMARALAILPINAERYVFHAG
jgi:hypothetical protein